MYPVGYVTKQIRLARLHRPVGIWLLMWPAFWALALYHSPILNYILFFVGAVALRSLGCIYNDYVDRNLDKHVARTKTRPLASGELKLKDALYSGAFFGAIGFVVWLNLNDASKVASLVGVLFLLLYPWAKRFTNYPQVVLGLSFSTGIIMAGLQVDPTLISAASLWFLYGASVCFTVAYDTIYGFQDIRDDKKIKNKSTSIVFEHHPKRAVGTLYLITLILLYGALIDDFGTLKSMVIIGLMFVIIAFVIKIWRPRSNISSAQIFYINHWIAGLFFILCSLVRIIP